MAATTTAATETLKRLAAAIDGYFKPTFLFDAYHSSWRQRASPAEGTEEYNNLCRGSDGLVIPPVVRLTSVIAYDDVQSAAKAAFAAMDVANAAATPTDEQLAAVVKAAVTDYSKVLLCVEDSAVGLCVRLVKMLSEDDNPIRRTVHMKPVHQNATEEEIRTFAVKHLIATTLKGQSEELVSKLILGVTKRTIVDVSANGLSRTVFYAHVEFSKKATAALFIASKPSYAAPDALCQHYLPQLKVKMLDDHMKEYEDIEARREAERSKQALFRAAQLQEQRQEAQQLLEAKKAAAASSSSATAAAGPSSTVADSIIPTAGTVQVTEQFLTKGKTLKVPNLPSNVTWRDVKVKLSNLFPDEKRLIRVVKDHEGAAYVVLFSPDKLEPLLSAWAADTYCHNVVPSLVKVEGEEEQWAIKQYPSWVSGFVTKKVIKNYKTATKRLRDEE